jgi:hypothetical protein
MRKASPFSNRKQNKRKRQDDSANGHQDIERGEQAASRVTQIWQIQSSQLNGAHLTPVRKDAKPQQDCASGKGADIMRTQKYWIRRLFYAQVGLAETGASTGTANAIHHYVHHHCRPLTTTTSTSAPSATTSSSSSSSSVPSSSAASSFCPRLQVHSSHHTFADAVVC